MTKSELRKARQAARAEGKPLTSELTTDRNTGPSEFTANGACVTPDFLIAYCGKDGKVTDWYGNTIGTYRITSRWSRWSSYGRVEMCAIRATVDGITYLGRGQGEGMIFRAKAVFVSLVQSNRAASTLNTENNNA